jgi:hypothetical protein
MITEASRLQPHGFCVGAGVEPESTRFARLLTEAKRDQAMLRELAH